MKEKWCIKHSILDYRPIFKKQVVQLMQVLKSIVVEWMTHWQHHLEY